MNSEIVRLIVERDIAYKIWDRNKTEDNIKLFLLLSKKLLKRLLSIFPSLSTALEILMKDQIFSFVIRFGLLNRLQSGFRSTHSTTTAFLNVTDGFHKNCERRMVTVLLLFDFSKAFDSVIHDLLSKKLSTIFKFDSRVSIGNELSSLVLILKGIVQGSILGPILFSLYINDIIDAIIFSQCHVYDCTRTTSNYILAVRDLIFLAQSKN
jgi:Reverse transcriptase (RNA-dependent DNA polymerase)